MIVLQSVNWPKAKISGDNLKKNQICTLSHGHFNLLNAGSQVQETNFILHTSYKKYLHFALPFWISHERYFQVSTNMPRIDP